MARHGTASNLRTGLLLAGLVASMAGHAFAAVPLYRLFCQVTGFDGTTLRAASAPEAVSERSVSVRFDANVNGALPWDFQPVQRELILPIGETALVFYRARNRSAGPVTGTATFNVTPLKVGAYFAKLDCFCFTEQTLLPGQQVDMAVSFFVDPAMLEDPETAGIRNVTLSYTFFRAAGDGRPEGSDDASAGLADPAAANATPN